MQKIFKNLYSAHPKLGQYATYILCILTVIRLIRDMIVKWVPTINPGTDLDIYFTGLAALLRGENPFDYALLGGRISFPAQMILMIPFYQMGETIGTVAFFVLSALLSFLMFKVVFRQLNLWHPPTSMTLTKENQFFLLSLCLFFNSPHLKHALYTGQLSQVAFSCLFLAMVAKGVFFRSLLLGIALAAKYSIVPFIGLAFLIIRDFRTCFFAGLVFLSIAALPALYGHNLLTLYAEYFTTIRGIVGACGIDSYCGGRGIDSMLHFEFFKIDAINNTVKAIFLVLFMIAFVLEYRRKSVSLNFLLFANAITLLIAYHRFYDMPALQLFMIAFLNIGLLKHLWIESSIFGIFILFSLIFVGWVHAFEYLLGTFVGESAWIYTISLDRYPVNFPLYAVYIFTVTCYSVYLYFRKDPKIIYLRRDASL